MFLRRHTHIELQTILIFIHPMYILYACRFYSISFIIHSLVCEYFYIDAHTK